MNIESCSENPKVGVMTEVRIVHPEKTEQMEVVGSSETDNIGQLNEIPGPSSSTYAKTVEDFVEPMNFFRENGSSGTDAICGIGETQNPPMESDEEVVVTEDNDHEEKTYDPLFGAGVAKYRLECAAEAIELAMLRSPSRLSERPVVSPILQSDMLTGEDVIASPIDNEQPGCSKLKESTVVNAHTEIKIGRTKRAVKKRESNTVFQRTIMHVLNLLFEHRHSLLFLKPLSPEYLAKVKRPVSLNTLKRDVRSGDISTISAFERDVRLMFLNAILLNPNGSNLSHVLEIRKDTEKILERHKRTLETICMKQAKAKQAPDISVLNPTVNDKNEEADEHSGTSYRLRTRSVDTTWSF